MPKPKPMTIDTLLGTSPPNRIEVAVARVEEQLDKMSDERKDALRKTLKLTHSEYMAYQNTQAQAHAGGRLTYGEAQIIYMALGGGSFEGDWPPGTSLALQIVITKLVVELHGH